jgi:methanethiol S-methyltransferase
MATVSTKVWGISMMALAIACGIGSLVFFVAYPLGSLTLTRMTWSDPWLLCWDAGLSLVFFLQHSGMNRRGFRRWITRWIAPSYHGAIYAIASGLALALVVGYWQPVATVVVSFHGVARLLERVVSVIGLSIFAWSLFAILGHDPLGLRPIMARLRGRIETSPRFMVRGPYRWIRHPLYSCAIVLLWTWPEITLDRLLFNVLWTAWIYVGTRFEERDLAHDFGAAYRAYQRSVPMLVPWRSPVDQNFVPVAQCE